LSRYLSNGQWQPYSAKPTGNSLEDLTNEYSVVMTGGKTRVVRWRKQLLPDGTSRDALELITKEDFTTFHSNKTAKIVDADSG